jgi:hypothetical protein
MASSFLCDSPLHPFLNFEKKTAGVHVSGNPPIVGEKSRLHLLILSRGF